MACDRTQQGVRGDGAFDLSLAFYVDTRFVSIWVDVLAEQLDPEVALPPVI